MQEETQLNDILRLKPAARTRRVAIYIMDDGARRKHYQIFSLIS